MKMSKIYGYLEEELRLPKNLSGEGKLIWLHNRLREVLEKNSASRVKAENLRKYTESLEEAVDYLLGIGDYRRLSNEARRIVMFLLSTRKAWTFTWRLVHKNPKEILKFLNTDLIPDIRKQIILNFLEEPARKPFQDWELKIIEDLTLNNTQCMYMTGRTYESIRSYRMHRKIERRKADTTTSHLSKIA
jgi:hypothetical protein